MSLRLCAWLLACLLGALGISAIAADKKGSGAALPEVPETLTPAQADAFLAKLTDAQVRALLARELHAKAAARVVPPSEPPVGLGPLIMDVVEKLEAAQVDTGRSSNVLAQGLAQLPGAMSAAAERVLGSPGSAAGALAVLAVALLAGVAASRALRRWLRQHGLEPALAVDARAAARFAAAGLRFVLDLASFAGFTLVVLAVAHAFTTAGTSSRILVIVYATAALLVASVAVLLRLVLAPHWHSLRPVPLTDDDARFLYRWLLAVAAVTIFGALSAQLFIRSGVSGEPGVMLTLVAGALTGVTLIVMMLRARMLRLVWRVLGAAYMAIVWLLWTGSLLDGRPSMAGAAAASLGILLAFPLVDYWIGRAIDDIVGQAPTDSTLRRQTVGQPLRWAMRVLVALLLFSAANELWGFQFFEWQVKLREAVLSASFDLVSAFAVAVLGWQFIKIAIDRRLEVHEVDGVRVEPSQRLRTLLPLARVFLVTGLIVCTIMLVLSGLGVNIGPLLAGAGIVGLAIGFGAQTLVRDIITGMFLILDDAFRVGEYIQSGSYKGTVESIGLRSVKLRHHRGPIYVVPFGELRGVQNVSRDWVIMKITVGVTYDSDLEKARKLVKKIGQELAADPELAGDILEPLKMQGVEEFGDFAIQIRMKIMTKPGDKQFMIRRRAFAMIKKAFDANGIKFAFPTVQVAGGAEAAVAAAATRLPSISGGEQAA